MHWLHLEKCPNSVVSRIMLRLTFLVLDFSLYIIDSITWFNLKGDGLAGQSFDKNLHGELKKNCKLDNFAKRTLFSYFMLEPKQLMIELKQILLKCERLMFIIIILIIQSCNNNLHIIGE